MGSGSLFRVKIFRIPSNGRSKKKKKNGSRRGKGKKVIHVKIFLTGAFRFPKCPHQTSKQRINGYKTFRPLPFPAGPYTILLSCKEQGSSPSLNSWLTKSQTGDLHYKPSGAAQQLAVFLFFIWKGNARYGIFYEC